jgi:hypothetical protein
MAKSTTERLFEAWREWDLEVYDPEKKHAAKQRLDQLTDEYKEQTKSGAARVLVRFWLREEYADWRMKNG